MNEIERRLGLQFGVNDKRSGGEEWHAPCGCAFHPEPFPHVHPCSNDHKRPDLHSIRKHRDDIAVDRFANAMKHKLAKARGKGRSGWDSLTGCTGEDLADALIEHLWKGNVGNYVDIANFCMMLDQRLELPDLLVDRIERKFGKRGTE